MPRRHRTSKSLHGPLTLEQDLALGLGIDPQKTYPNPLDARRAWFEHRDKLMGFGSQGTRPWAWWIFEQGREKPVSSNRDEAAILAAMGELTDAEIADLRASARKLGGIYLSDWEKIERAVAGSPPKESRVTSNSAEYRMWLRAAGVKED